MGFTNLYGLEINKNSVKIAQENNPMVTFFNSSIEEFEFDEKYDLVYTAGVLIHINPEIMDFVINKIINMTNQFIFGFEYFSDELVEIEYRGNAKVCWKQNFPHLFKKSLPSIITVMEEKFTYINNENMKDVAYLLRK